MITRIEIDGFKSFADFSLDLPPFLAVIGTNVGGTSSLLGAVRGDPVGIFRRRGDGSRPEETRFAVEPLVDFEGGGILRKLVCSHWRRSPGTRRRYELAVRANADDLIPRDYR